MTRVWHRNPHWAYKSFAAKVPMPLVTPIQRKVGRVQDSHVRLFVQGDDDRVALRSLQFIVKKLHEIVPSRPGAHSIVSIRHNRAEILSQALDTRSRRQSVLQREMDPECGVDLEYSLCWDSTDPLPEMVDRYRADLFRLGFPDSPGTCIVCSPDYSDQVLDSPSMATVSQRPASSESVHSLNASV